MKLLVLVVGEGETPQDLGRYERLEASWARVCPCSNALLFLPAGVNETAEYDSGKWGWAHPPSFSVMT